MRTIGRCAESHWFSTDPIGCSERCVLPNEHDGEHEDSQGRWWEVYREQRMPVANDSPPIVDMVIADLRERDRIGRSKYGTSLQAHNGRDPLVDAYEEQLDNAQYMKQAIIERDSLRSQLAAVTAERDRLREALGEACDELDHAWPYAGDYFEDKWRDKAKEAEWRKLASPDADSKEPAR